MGVVAVHVTGGSGDGPAGVFLFTLMLLVVVLAYIGDVAVCIDVGIIVVVNGCLYHIWDVFSRSSSLLCVVGADVFGRVHYANSDIDYAGDEGKRARSYLYETAI